MCRYRLDADSPAALRDHGQKERRRQLEKAVSQGNKAVVKVSPLFSTWWPFINALHLCVKHVFHLTGVQPRAHHRVPA